ncbi:glycosyltransferase [Streptacidiphilus sp. ASG 303]|uniref:glycosyltransferase family 2 protein n=1 Tax=Streptacidiphilus sp. ASG 303 TaxID=2896847 RepID=UPI001E36D119|nr:glycosyltransferase family 2 protein [Streptacidiphilus sp. ASG 303]MCD0482085.1 glycosyltransferase [Streptacidiphilus sp. ASG 303]
MSVGEPRVSVVVIVFDDADRIAEAVHSALDQGDAVGEVLVVDDGSTDATPEVLARLAAGNPRVRVLTRPANSGGCGTPRNEGIAAAREPYVMLLDSDDVLPPGAARTLLDAATAHRADVAAGVAVRRELPGGPDTPWQRDLYPPDGAAPLLLPDGIGTRPGFLRDTLSAGKLYDRSFLERHGVRFADGDVHYEDFLFTAMVYAARPRLVAIPDPVYHWHVRRGAGRQSISLRRDEIRNWRDRVDAHAGAVRALGEAGEKSLADAAATKFLDYDLRMYVRELGGRSDAYLAEWWTITREYLKGFDPSAAAAAHPAARWITAAVLASDRPVEVGRLIELAAGPARLVPPYLTAADGSPVLGAGDAAVPLDGLDRLPLTRLPVAVDGAVRIGRRCEVRLRLHELYGRLAPAAPESVALELRSRSGAPPVALSHAAPLVRSAGPAAGPSDGPARAGGTGRPGAAVNSGDTWTAALPVDVFELVRAGRAAAPMTAWTLWADVRFADGRTLTTAVRAPGGVSRRSFAYRPPAAFALVQAHTTASGGLGLRIAGGLSGVREVAGARLARLLARLQH